MEWTRLELKEELERKIDKSDSICTALRNIRWTRKFKDSLKKQFQI